MTLGNGPSLWDTGVDMDRITSARTPVLVRAHVEFKVRGDSASQQMRAFHSLVVDELRERGVLD